MTVTRAGDLRVHVVGGPVEPGGAAVVLCHGFGAAGDDLVSLARGVDVGGGVRWFFPEAPLTIDFGGGMAGRAWWPIDMVALQSAMMRGESRDLEGAEPPGMSEARVALEGSIAALVRDQGLDPSRTVLGGFSQGGMLATEVALHATSPFAGLAVLSGTLMCRERWTTAARRQGAALHAVVTHGRRDPLLPFAGAEALRDVLLGAGADVRFIAHGGQHEIPASALDGLAELARRTLSRG